MKAEIKITPEAAEPYAVIYAKEIDSEVRGAAAMLEGSNQVITAQENGRIFIIEPEEIDLVCAGEQKTVIICGAKEYSSSRRLYEFEELLGSGFMRISKSTIVNLKKITCVEPTFGGLMELVLRSGRRAAISRSFLPKFKKYLGM